MLYQLYCRAYQCVFRLVSHFLPWREPKLLQGEHALADLPKEFSIERLQKLLIVTDQTVAKLPFFIELCDHLKQEKLTFTVFDNVIPNPTINNIEEGRALYLQQQCEAIIAIGGGSVIDCAKGIAARLTKPNKTIPQLKGQLKIRKHTPKIFAIPTTSGTGSEATVAAVISDSRTKEKYAINDLSLIPYCAVLDPTITLKLPPFITATTGIDALTHAVEAYIGKSNTTLTKKYALEAVKLIFDNIELAYSQGDNIKARANMQIAAYKAGVAFTRAYVGNVHAIAHTLGGFYHIPHGLANAVIMPYILRFYGATIHKPLAELAEAAHIGTAQMSIKERAEAFISAIEQLNHRLAIPTTLEGIQDNDIEVLVQRALVEANPLYPVPVIMNKAQMIHIYKQLQG